MLSHETSRPPDGESCGHVVIAGASGVIGAPAVAAFARAGWHVTALSRRRPIVPEDCAFDHLALDFSDADACAQAVADLPPVTHLVYAAVSEAPGLSPGWVDEDLIAKNGAMLRHVLGPLAETGNLRHVSILQGTKAYGAHLHPVTLPLRESSPRDDHPNFYWLHEDFTREQAAKHGFAFTIWRPQVLLGSAPGAAMNPVAAIGAYSAVCRERGLPFTLPGEAVGLWEIVDADLFADALIWSATSKEAAGETFNFTNGDLFALRHAWRELADALDLSSDGNPPESFASFFAQAESQTAWQAIAAREGLLLGDLDALLGQSHIYLDILNSGRAAQRVLPMVVSTIKLRHAGFAGCIDSFDSLRRQLAMMVALKLLPRHCDPRHGAT